jgi:hypothetical protein
LPPQPVLCTARHPLHSKKAWSEEVPVFAIPKLITRGRSLLVEALAARVFGEASLARGEPAPMTAITIVQHMVVKSCLRYIGVG